MKVSEKFIRKVSEALEAKSAWSKFYISLETYRDEALEKVIESKISEIMISEEFLDKLIDRINRKQIKRSGFDSEV